MAAPLAKVRPATVADHASLVPLLRDFHAHEGIRSPPGAAEGALGRVLREPQRGRLFVAENEGAIVAYVAVCFGYSIEFNGVDAFVDELYVAPAQRGRGIGRALLDAAEGLCRAEGVVALHLEVDHANPRAHELYLRRGFKDHARHLMTKRLVG